MSMWQEAQTQLPCGCYAKAEVYLTEGVIPEQALTRFFAHVYNWPDCPEHDREHADLCHRALPALKKQGTFWIDEVKVFTGEWFGP